MKNKSRTEKNYLKKIATVLSETPDDPQEQEDETLQRQNHFISFLTLEILRVALRAKG